MKALTRNVFLSALQASLIFLFALPADTTQAADVAIPEFQLANIYHSTIQLTDYWVSEKFDGVRAFWDGEQLISRRGNVFHAPAWFTASLPDTALDGELWLARNKFDDLSGIVRRHKADDHQWRQVNYMIFDLPESGATFEFRYQQLKELFSKQTPSWIKLVEQYEIATEELLMKKLRQITDQGGEGLMLHKKSAYYQGQRNDNLLKLKLYQDKEAKVIEHIPGKGKFRGMMGSLLVERQDGTRFRIGTGFTDMQRRQPPPVGSFVTYRYNGKTSNGLPRFARFLRIRDSVH